jgi:SRSO17 transposase
MSLLDHPDALALLDDATLTPQSVHGCRDRLTQVLKRSLPRFSRQEQRGRAAVVVHGLLSGLERKTAEPIAYHAGLDRKNLQDFVGCGQWDDDAVQAQLRGHVPEEWADPEAVGILDPRAFPKKGTESCGVARQGCGRLGKVDNWKLCLD